MFIPLFFLIGIIGYIFWKKNSKTKKISKQHSKKNTAPAISQPPESLSLKRLSLNQASCLSDAISGIRIYREVDINNPKIYEGNVRGVMHPTRTVNSLVKHGLLEEVEDAGFAITTLGALAIRTLPIDP